MLKWVFFNKYFYIGLIALTVLAGYGYYRSQSKIVTVRAVELNGGTVAKTVSGSGVIKSEKETVLTFPAAGSIVHVNASKGDEVFDGQLLAQIYNIDIQQSVLATKESVEIAKRDKDLFIRRYEDDKSAVGGNKAYQIELKKLDDIINRAEASYQSAQAGLRNYYLYAPFSGTLVDVFVKRGESVNGSIPIAKIADLNSLVFEMTVDQEDFGSLLIGQDVEITLDSYPNLITRGNVYKLPFYADSLQNSFNVQITLVESEIPVLLGMRGNAKIVTAVSSERSSALVFDSIFYDEDKKPYIWVDRDGRIYKKFIDVGIEGDIYVEVLSSVSDRVVVPVTDLDKVVEGKKIKYRP
jgi:RND family efflux transporter MFP subunit